VCDVEVNLKNKVILNKFNNKAIMAPTLLYTILYILLSLCFVYPPNEFISAGFTVQSLLSTWLGSENERFIQYHMRRIVATILWYSVLPLGKFKFD
jgi:hypothetical protein